MSRKFYYYKFVFTADRLDKDLVGKWVTGGVFRLYERLPTSKGRLSNFVRDLVDVEIFDDDAQTHGTTFVHSGVNPFRFAGSHIEDSGSEGQWSITIEELHTFENEIGEGEGSISVTHHI